MELAKIARRTETARFQPTRRVGRRMRAGRALAGAVRALSASAAVAQTPFVEFESGPVRPLALSPDGQHRTHSSISGVTGAGNPQGGGCGLLGIEAFAVLGVVRRLRGLRRRS